MQFDDDESNRQNLTGREVSACVMLECTRIRSTVFVGFFHLITAYKYTKQTIVPSRLLAMSSSNGCIGLGDRTESDGTADWKASLPVDSFLSDAGSRGCYWLNVRTSKRDESWEFVKPIGFIENHVMCIHRWKIWWAIPRIIRSKHLEADAPAETHMLVGKLITGNYLLMLPLVDNNMGFSLEGLRSLSKADNSESTNAEGSIGGGLFIHGHENSPNDLNERSGDKNRRALLLSEGSSIFPLLRKSFSIARTHLRRQANVSTSSPESLPDDDDSEELSPFEIRFHLRRGIGPSFANELGWCTWDSFYTGLSNPRVLGGLKSFRDTNVQPRFLILDDGWQRTDVDDKANGYQWGGRLISFNANYKFSENYDRTEVQCSSSTDVDSFTEYDDSEKRLSGGTVNPECDYSLEYVSCNAKSEYGIRNLLVWHTLSGYWAGVQPADSDTNSNGKLAKYEARLTFPVLTASMKRMAVSGDLDREPFSTHGVGLVPNHLIADFFHDYHSSLRSMGVDGVKVDAQSILPSLKSLSSGWQSASAFHLALRDSTLSNFGFSKDCNNSISKDNVEFPIIHCMCHSQGTLLSILAVYPSSADTWSDIATNEYKEFKFNRIEQRRRLVPIIRGSDDYWPTLSCSHAPHIFVNALNSILISYIGLHDWDMFQTNMGRPSELHAASRAISGGPVYVSDHPDFHNTAVLRKLSFPNGALPRALRSAHPVEQYLFLDPQRQTGIPLLVQNINPAGGLVVGAFHVFGSVLEDDVDYFRIVRLDEVEWTSFNVSTIESYQMNYRNWFKNLNDKNTTSGAPWYLDELFVNELLIKCAVSPLSVEEAYEELEALDSSANTCIVMSPCHTVSRSQYIGFKFSSSECFDIDLKSLEIGSSIEVTLRRPLDWDIITFAPKNFWNQKTWCAVIGAIEMYNPGGAVLAVRLSVRAKNSLLLEVELMGGVGKYLIACSKFLMPDCMQIVKAINIDGYDEIVDIDSFKMSYNVDVDVNYKLIEITVDSLRDVRKDTHSILVHVLFRS